MAAGAALRADPVHVITGKGDGIQLQNVKRCLGQLRTQGLVKDFSTINGGGFHVRLQ